MRIILALLCLTLVFGCIGGKECQQGYIKAGSECCLDDNNNGICDDQELEKLVLVVKPPVPTCDDSEQNQGETGMDCGGPCEPCPTSTTQVSPPEDNENIGTKAPTDSTSGTEINRSKTDTTGIGGESGGEYSNLTRQGAVEAENISTNRSSQTGEGEIPIETNMSAQSQEEILKETLNSSFCTESKQYLTSTEQDGYIGDESELSDRIGDKVVSTAYNVVGDATFNENTSNRTSDMRYKTVIAVPIGNLPRIISDARLNVLLSGKTGDVSDTLVEHISCTGMVRSEDYSSTSDGYVGKIIKASDGVDIYYSIDVSEFIQRDIGSNLKYSCYRFYWDDKQMDRLNDKKTERITFYGYGSEYAPYLSYIKRPCVRCKMNKDCGEMEYITDYECSDNTVRRQYLHYRCAQPDTEDARCVITQDANVVDRCTLGESCIAGEDRCFPETCYDGMNNGREYMADCGGPCRPCSCFNRRRDTKESTGNESTVEEKGIDCGGDCKPCPIDFRVLKVQILSPNARDVYDSRDVYFRYYVNKNPDTCLYSLNGEFNKTISINKDIRVNEGENNLTLYCNDSLGQQDNDSVRFNVESEYVVCQTDKTNVSYTKGFDKIVFFTDNSSQANLVRACDKELFLKATTLNDSIKHYAGPVDATKLLKDKLFNEGGAAELSFNCEDRLDYEVTYAHLSKAIAPSNTTQLKIISYFSESGNASRRDTFWRFYFYGRNKNAVKNSTYLDIPYRPLYSSCENETGMRYQELDLTPLAANMTFSSEASTELRMAMYAKYSGVKLDLKELRLWVG